MLDQEEGLEKGGGQHEKLGNLLGKEKDYEVWRCITVFSTAEEENKMVEYKYCFQAFPITTKKLIEKNDGE